MWIQPGQNETRITRLCRAAFTLIEVLVSAAIAAVIFVAVFASVSMSFSILTNTRQNLRATQIMVSRIEGLRLQAWDSTNQLTELFNTNYVPTAFTESFYPLGLTGSTNQGITYYGTMTVSDLTNSAQQTSVFGSTIPSYATNMALVTITLNWTNSTTGITGEGKSHSRTISTLVAAYGIENYVFSAQ